MIRRFMPLWSAIFDEGIRDQTLPIFLGLVLTAALVGAFAPGERRRMRSLVFLFAMHLILVPVAGLLQATQSELYNEVRFVCLLFAALSFVPGSYAASCMAPGTATSSWD